MHGITYLLLVSSAATFLVVVDSLLLLTAFFGWTDFDARGKHLLQLPFIPGLLLLLCLCEELAFLLKLLYLFLLFLLLKGLLLFPALCFLFLFPL